MDTYLHDLRIEAVVRQLENKGCASILDLGCGRGALLERLLTVPQFTRLVGIDIDRPALLQARHNLAIDLLRPNPRVALHLGSFAEVNPELSGFDAAVLLETIEHIHAGDLPRVERAVFFGMRPRWVLVTTPNRDFNPVHGLAPGQRRHPGHRFEWTREQFRHWADGIAQRNAYQVEYQDIGWPQEHIGGSTQMACFGKT